jgi:4a-hydroxytetrahydrobiopterin dehydratase
VAGGGCGHDRRGSGTPRGCPDGSGAGRPSLRGLRARDAAHRRGPAVELEAQLDPSWARDGTLRLRRELRFRNFRDAFGFVARLALLAESEGHHPDIELGWGRVAVTLTTHAAGGLTDNDFILAARLDRL